MATKAKTEAAGFPGDEGYQDSDWDHFKPAYEDSGRQIKWESLPEGAFYGTFTGMEVKETVDQATGEKKEVNLLKFHGRDNENYCAFANYALQKVVEDGGFSEGVRVKIIWYGKEDIGNGQSMNRISVFTS